MSIPKNNILSKSCPGNLPGPDQIFVHVKFFERLLVHSARDYILYIIYNSKLQAAQNFVHLPKFARYFVRARQILLVCSSCKSWGSCDYQILKAAGQLLNQIRSSCENLTFFKKLHAAASNFYFFIFRTRQLQKSNFTRCPRKAAN